MDPSNNPGQSVVSRPVKDWWWPKLIISIVVNMISLVLFRKRNMEHLLTKVL